MKSELGGLFVEVRVHRDGEPVRTEKRPAYIDRVRVSIVGRIVPSEVEQVIPHSYPGERVVHVVGEGWHSYPAKRAM